MVKYIIEIPDEYEKSYAQTNSKTLYIPMQVGTRNYNVWVGTGLRVTPYTEPDENEIRQKIEDDVWEFSRKVECMGIGEIEEAFDIHRENAMYPFNQMSYKEAKAAYEAWKKSKEEIHVGDEVEYECDGEVVKFIVTGVSGSIIYGFKSPCGYDDVGEWCDIKGLRKTGRHFDEVEELLKKLRRMRQHEQPEKLLTGQDGRHGPCPPHR